MASYGEGFASGLDSGSRFANNMLSIYDQAQKKKAIEAMYDNGAEEARKQIDSDLSSYDSQRASLFEGGYKPSQEELSALDNGYSNIQNQKPSELFNSQLMGMNSQERLGHMVQLAQQGGLKINDNTLNALQGVNSIFDNVQQADVQHTAQQNQLFKFQQEQQLLNAQGQYVRKNYADKLSPEMLDMSDTQLGGLFAPLMKDDQYGDKLQNAMLMNQLTNATRLQTNQATNDTREQIAQGNNDTKQLIASIAQGNKASNEEWKRLEYELRREKFEAEKAEKADKAKAKDLETRQKLYQQRYKDSEKLVPTSLSDDKDINAWKEYYARYGVAPKTKKEDGLFGKTVYLTNTPPASKAPSQAQPSNNRANIVQAIKAQYPNATQDQINAYLKKKGY